MPTTDNDTHWLLRIGSGTAILGAVFAGDRHRHHPDAETYDSSMHLCLCGHNADHHLVGFFVVWKLQSRDGRCTQCECTALSEDRGELADGS